jgi:ornithine carbamoyltransferase
MKRSQFSVKWQVNGPLKVAEPRHFLDIDQFDEATLRDILARGVAFKDGSTDNPRPLEGKMLAMVFEKPSTRTRVSFHVGMRQLGGDAVVLSPDETHLGRGESIADTARVLSRYVDAIMIRTSAHEKLEELAAHASVPVINGLTDKTHPCQVMADVMTFEERRGSVRDQIVAWSGDGNNVVTSWIHAAVAFGFELRIACPDTLSPSEEVLVWAKQNGGNVHLTRDVAEAVAGADCVVTDVWLSMGDESESRNSLLRPFQVDDQQMARAKSDALFMHCLPAHRGEEVTASVIDGQQSVVWDEAENRLHAQKGILSWCFA